MKYSISLAALAVSLAFAAPAFADGVDNDDVRAGSDGSGERLYAGAGRGKNLRG